MRILEGQGTCHFLPHRPLLVSSPYQAEFPVPRLDVDAAVTGGGLDRYGVLQMLTRKEHKNGKSVTLISRAIKSLHLTVSRELLSNCKWSASCHLPATLLPGHHVIISSSSPKWTDSWNPGVTKHSPRGGTVAGISECYRRRRYRTKFATDEGVDAKSRCFLLISRHTTKSSPSRGGGGRYLHIYSDQ